jgi:hypothetical protein
MLGLMTDINSIFLWCLHLFVYLPLVLVFWLAVGTFIAFFIGPLGYGVAFLLALHYSND